MIRCLSGFMIFEPNLACSHSFLRLMELKKTNVQQQLVDGYRAHDDVEINRNNRETTRCEEKDSILYNYFLYIL